MIFGSPFVPEMPDEPAFTIYLYGCVQLLLQYITKLCNRWSQWSGAHSGPFLAGKKTLGIQWAGKGKGEGQFYARTGHEDPEGEYRYSSTLSSISALDGGGWWS